MNCLQCSKIGLKAYPHHVREGLGRCSAQPCAVFEDFRRDRQCANFAPANPEIVASRQRWADGIAK